MVHYWFCICSPYKGTSSLQNLVAIKTQNKQKAHSIYNRNYHQHCNVSKSLSHIVRLNTYFDLQIHNNTNMKCLQLHHTMSILIIMTIISMNNVRLDLLQYRRRLDWHKHWTAASWLKIVRRMRKRQVKRALHKKRQTQ